MVITCSAAAELLGWRSVTCVQSVVCAVCILSPLHTHSLDMRHTALFSSHEIRGFTLTTRECVGVASIEAQEVVASLCLLGDDVHTLSEITCTLLASYIIWSNGYEKMRNITSNCEGDLHIELSLCAWVIMFKLECYDCLLLFIDSSWNIA